MACGRKLLLLLAKLSPLERSTLLYVYSVLVFSPTEACATEDGGTSAAALLLCRSCGHELAHGTDIEFVPSRMAMSIRNDTLVGGQRVNVQLFENPHGQKFEVITFRKADIKQHWPADEHFSWFPGFSWTAATCPRCGTHLGWAFQPSVWPDVVTKAKFDESQRTFLALIAHRLLTEGFASSLLVTPRSFVS
ncbi:uncharacterized protein si:ch211-51h9.7 [Brachionichthys hirsutus]|uniref:uncharacterized protein si:ch211-51h9.7 n=1 Tax=Brachionichthys hirsutus TaxID=412623 RepID=UPI003604ED61